MAPHTVINNVASAKMSIPYSVAVAIITGKAGMDEYSLKYINDVDLSLLVAKVNVLSDDKFTAQFPTKSISSIEIMLKDGSTLFEQVDLPKGEPENPLSNNEIDNKFMSLSEYAGVEERKAVRIMDTVKNLDEELENLYDLL